MFMCISPPHATAQAESLFTNINDINVFASCWSTRSDFLQRSNACPNQYGLEVYWELTSFRLWKKAPPPSPPGTWQRSEKEVTVSETGQDSIVRYTWAKAEPPAPAASLSLELALGYSHFSGFEASEPAYELRGTVRELPAIALYGSVTNTQRYWNFAQPYLGVRTGLIQLQNVQALVPIDGDSVVAHPGNAQVFQAGFSAGLAIGRSPIFGTVEYSHHIRRFPSVQWGGTGSTRLPADLPTEFDFSGPSLALGIQVRVREPK
jgi:hypothetical protein